MAEHEENVSAAIGLILALIWLAFILLIPETSLHLFVERHISPDGHINPETIMQIGRLRLLGSILAVLLGGVSAYFLLRGISLFSRLRKAKREERVSGVVGLILALIWFAFIILIPETSLHLFVEKHLSPDGHINPETIMQIRQLRVLGGILAAALGAFSVYFLLKGISLLSPQKVMMAPHRPVSRLFETLLIFTLLIFLFSRFFMNVDAVPFHGDESHWIYMGRVFWTFFIHKDFENPLFGITNPPVGKYLIGFALYASGHREEEINLPWVFGKSYDWNIKHGRVPRQDHLRVARLTMATFGGLVGLLFYFIGRKVYGIWAGLVMCLLWALNPAALVFTRRAATDAPLLFFLFSTLLINLWLVSHFCRNRPISYFKTLGFSFLAGVSLFLAAGSKLNGGLGGLGFILVMGVFLVQGSLKPSFLTGLKSSVVKLVSYIPRDKVISIISGLFLGIGGVSLIFAGKVGLVLLPAFLFLTFLAAARAKVANISLTYAFKVLIRQRFFIIVTILYSICAFYFLINGLRIFRISFFALILAFILRLLTYPVFREPLQALKRHLTRHRLAPAALISIILLGVISLSLFVLSNPMLYDDPVMGIKSMLRLRIKIIQGQRANAPLSSLDTLPKKVISVYQRVFYKYDVFARIFRFPLGLLLLFLGVAKLTRDEIKSIKSTRCLSEKGALLIWAVVVISATTLWIPLRWGRYYLPIVAFSIILMGIGLVFLLELVGRALGLLILRVPRS